MSTPADAENPSLRTETSRIRHLDAARARAIVAAFRRPVVAGGDGEPAYDPLEPVAGATRGWLKVAGGHDVGVVGHYQTHLYLHELLRLPLTVARELAKHSGHLYLDRLESISDVAAAALGAHRGGGLSLNNLRRLSAAAATSLGRRGGELSFLRVKRLSAAAALGLAQHANRLHLDGLESLRPAVAAALSRHRGDLSLDALTRLTGREATHLARHAGKLHLHGLATLGWPVAEAFARREGYLCLQNLGSLTADEAALLARHRGPLHLHSLDVTDAVAACLGTHEGSLFVRVPNTIPVARLRALVQHGGPLSLGGLTALGQPRAAVLAAQPAFRGHRGLSGLFIDGVTAIAPAVAATLATHTAGTLSLNGHTEISADVARELVRHPLLSLDGLVRISDEVATILASHAGASLSLRSLEEVSPRALACLLDNPGVDLGRRADSSGSSQGEHDPGTLLALITRIAAAGEEALRRGGYRK